MSLSIVPVLHTKSQILKRLPGAQEWNVRGEDNGIYELAITGKIEGRRPPPGKSGRIHQNAVLEKYAIWPRMAENEIVEERREIMESDYKCAVKVTVEEHRG